MGEISNYRGELVSRLRAVTDDIAWAARGINDSEAHYRPASDEWTIHEHLSHMADMEREVYLPLLRWATVPDMLDPLDYSRRDWHETRYRPEEPAARMVEDLGRMRDEELLIFRQMGDTAWTRYRTDTRWGPLSCQWLAELMYRHALDHLQGLMALKQDLHLADLTPPPVVVGGYIGGRA